MHDTKLSILSHYLNRGWALVPLHDVTAGRCSCNRDCRSAGKHPRWERWQQAGQLVRDARTLSSYLYAPGGDRWNWGVATGPVSGIWALDVDIEHGGEAALAQLRAELANAGEMLPDTLTMGPTGGGGRHMIYAWPAVGREIHGSQTKNRYGLAPGLDVRGLGGQIVVAPSVSGKGPYGGILVDLPIAAVGPVLLDRLTGGKRGAAVDVEPRIPTPAVGSITSTPSGVNGEVAYGGITAARYRAYAGAAVEALFAELANESEGARNDTAMRTARRLIEFINAPWCPEITLEYGWNKWMTAGQASGLPAEELDGVWRRQAEYIGDKPADPPSDDGWHGVGGTVIPFSSISPAAGSVNGGRPDGGTAPGDPFADPGQGGGQRQMSQQPTVDPFEQAVAVELGRVLVREEARRRAELRRGGDPAERLARLAGALVDTEGLDTLPELRPVVSGLLYLDTCARIIGPSGHGKSFVALDLAGAIGAGMAWAGRAVAEGSVVYLAAEGVAGIRKRVRAWEIRHQRKMINVEFLPFAVQAMAPEWDSLIEVCRTRQRSLIVLDTQARITVGVNENDASEMGQVVDALERLRSATGACVLLVHHKGLNGQQGRGSTAVRAALQSELDVSKMGPLVTVATLKQKDGEEAAPIVFRLEKVNVERDAFAPADDGAVLTWLPDAVAPGSAGLSDDELTGKTGEAALVARRVFAGGIGGTKAEYRAILMTSKEHSIKITTATFYRVWADLMERKIIGKTRGTASWIYVEPGRREDMVEPVIGDKDNKGGFYAPM